MSNCACCGGCKFPCCGNKSPSNVCFNVNKARVFDVNDGIGAATSYNFHIRYGVPSTSNDAECSYNQNYTANWVQYKKASTSFGNFSINGVTNYQPYVNDANLLNIFIDSVATFGNGVAATFYLLFPLRKNVHHNSINNCDTTLNYTEELGYGIQLGGLGQISATYDFTETEQYRIIYKLLGNVAGDNSSTSYSLEEDISFGNFGLCRCCTQFDSNNYDIFNNGIAQKASQVGALYGYILMTTDVPNGTINNNDSLAASIKINQIVAIYDRTIPSNAIRISCPAYTLCATQTGPHSVNRQVDVSPTTGKNNTNGWGEVLVPPSNSTYTTQTSSPIPAIDCGIGVIVPKTQSVDERTRQGLNNCINAINQDVGTIGESWIMVDDVFRNLGLNSVGATLPFQLQDLDGSIFYQQVNRNINGIDFAYPEKITNLSNRLANDSTHLPSSAKGFKYLQDFLDANPSSYSADCTKINQLGSTFLTFAVNAYKGVGQIGRLFHYEVTANKMQDKVLSCVDTATTLVQKKYCNDCYSVYISGLGYVTKYFRLTEVPNQQGFGSMLSNIDMFYNPASNKWESGTRCRVLNCNRLIFGGQNTIMEQCAVTFSLEFKSTGAELTVSSTGGNTYSETYILANNGDCKLLTKSLYFVTKQDSSPITNHFLQNCNVGSPGAINLSVPISYLLVPFWMLYPNNR